MKGNKKSVHLQHCSRKDTYCKRLSDTKQNILVDDISEVVQLISYVFTL